ncbi:M24 family metallopeptidase [Halorubrum sp. DTA46]|uniref:M24 family metallopeptidase n=1 Tax=Halorubrum sp. DTA46 TaxID=3402162 RepID=UPI003AAAF7C2
MEFDSTAADALSPLRTDLNPVVEAVTETDVSAGAGAETDAGTEADAFVAIGDGFDDDIRYLTRFSGPDRAYALVVVPASTGAGEETGPRAVLCAPSLFAGQAEREFVAAAGTDERAAGPAAFRDGVVREVRTGNVGDHAGERAAAVVNDLLGGDDTNRLGDDDTDRTVLVPASIPHDAAVYLERAGNSLVSTDAVARARSRKTDAEVDRLRRVQRATVAGMRRAEAVLAKGESGDDTESDEAGDRPPLRRNGEALTTERLRREVNAVLAREGVRDAGNTVIGTGPSAADLHCVGDDPIRPGETVLIDISPRGPDGYYGDMTRTFVVDGDGGWERRAYVAVEAAREAALEEIEPGVTAATVHGEAAAELAAYGFDPNAEEGEAGFTHGTGHGVGVSLHESPSLSSGTELRPGHVVTVEPGVYDPEIGGVRLEDLVVVTDDGYDILATYPFEIVPRER